MSKYEYNLLKIVNDTKEEYCDTLEMDKFIYGSEISTGSLMQQLIKNGLIRPVYHPILGAAVEIGCEITETGKKALEKAKLKNPTFV